MLIRKNLVKSLVLAAFAVVIGLSSISGVQLRHPEKPGRPA